MKALLSCLVLMSALGLAGCAAPPPADAPPGADSSASSPPRHPFSNFDPSKAEKDFHRDLAAGKLKLLTFGLPAAWSEDYGKLLQTEMGVGYVPVAGCVVDENLVKYVSRYNKLSQKEIESRFGPDKLGELARKAERNWKLRHPLQS